MTVLVYLLALPLASELTASLLGLRDGGRTPWRLVRVLLVALVLLSLIRWLGDMATYAIGAALATIVSMQIIGYLVWRFFVIGIRQP